MKRTLPVLALLAALTLPAAAQIDAMKIKPPLGVVPASAQAMEIMARMKSPAQAAPTGRLGNADWSLMRASIADKLKLSPSALAPAMVNASNLSAPGNVVHLQVGLALPSGFMWTGRHVDAFPASLWTPVMPNPGERGTATVWFGAAGAPRGTYLITAYMVTTGSTLKLSSVNCQVYYGNLGTPPMAVPVQAGKVMVPFVLPTTADLWIAVEMPWVDRFTPNAPYGGVLACDFFRIM